MTFCMPWGKFRGTSIKEVPGSYLIWLLEAKAGDDQRLFTHVREEILRRHFPTGIAAQTVEKDIEELRRQHAALDHAVAMQRGEVEELRGRRRTLIAQIAKAQEMLGGLEARRAAIAAAQRRGVLVQPRGRAPILKGD